MEIDVFFNQKKQNTVSKETSFEFALEGRHAFGILFLPRITVPFENLSLGGRSIPLPPGHLCRDDPAVMYSKPCILAAFARYVKDS